MHRLRELPPPTARHRARLKNTRPSESNPERLAFSQIGLQATEAIVSPSNVGTIGGDRRHRGRLPHPDFNFLNLAAIKNKAF